MPDIVDMLQELPQAITPGPAGPEVVAADVARGHRALGLRRRHRLAGAAGAVVVGAAAAMAVVLAIPSAPRPTGPVGPVGPIAKGPAVKSPLVILAARISADPGALPGNASLEIVSQIVGGNLMQVYY